MRVQLECAEGGMRMLDTTGIVKVRITGLDGRLMLETDSEHFSFPRVFVHDVPVNNIIMIKGKDMPEDISRKTANVIFDKEVSSEIISKAIDQSAFMQLAQKMEIAGNGKKFQTITGDPIPEWVGETEAKPVGKFDFGTKEIEPYKMAIIVPFSDEFKRDKTALYNESIGNPWFVMRTLMTAKNSNFSSYWAAQKKMINKQLGKAVDKMKSLGN